jgi:hypothetical protein
MIDLFMLIYYRWPITPPGYAVYLSIEPPLATASLDYLSIDCLNHAVNGNPTPPAPQAS